MPKFSVAVADPLGTRPLGHRHDVDGLRAVAVLAILAFHLDLAGFSGGFVGVDIFFVISGYVILRSILPDLENGRFSLADFFVRRMRRLLPALMVVLLATLAAGLVILSPAELQELAGSALATLGFVANIFFYDRTGYFAAAAHTRPLLHMWSLGIEEQFYILVPLALAALMRWRGVAAGKPLVALAVASFGYGLIAAVVSETHAFYMPMARFWEIAVGGCVAVAERRWGRLERGAGWVGGLGLLVVAASVVLLDSDRGGQQWAAIAVLGTAAVIATAPSDRSWITVALAATPMVAIGRLSYSIYLVHWPLIVFWRLYTVHPLLPHEQILIALLTFALALALSTFVETPMRAGSHRIGNRPALAAVFSANTVVAAAAVAVILDGAPWRLAAPALEAYNALRRATQERPRCHDESQRLALPKGVCRWSPGIPGTDFVIWGDSHAGALAPELAGVIGDNERKSGLLIDRAGCKPLVGVTTGKRARMTCPGFADKAIQIILREKPKVVVIAARWATVASDVGAPVNGKRSGQLFDLENDNAPIGLADALVRTVDRVRASGAQVVLVGPVPEIAYHVPSMLIRSLHGTGLLPTVRRTEFDLRQKQVLSALATLQGREGVIVVYPHTDLCNDEVCKVADGVRSLYSDDDHLSPFGAARISKLISSAIAASRVDATQ